MLILGSSANLKLSPATKPCPVAIVEKHTPHKSRPQRLSECLQQTWKTIPNLEIQTIMRYTCVEVLSGLRKVELTKFEFQTVAEKWLLYPMSALISRNQVKMHNS